MVSYALRRIRARSFAALMWSLLLLLLLTSVAFAAPADEIPLPSIWQFRLDPENVGVSRKWQSAEWSSGVASIKVGSAWEPQGYVYDGYAWYRTEVVVPDSFLGRRITVRFGGVDEDAWVYWDGHLAGRHSGWAAGFDVDVTALVQLGKPNVLAVRVHDTTMMGGIYRPVSISSSAPAEEAPIVKRLRDEGVRMAQVATAGDSVKVMADAGCNVLMLQTWSLSGVKKTTATDSEEIIRESDLASLRTLLDGHAQRCKQQNVISLCNFYGLSEVEGALLREHRYEYWVDAAGARGTMSPCPLSRRYWMGFLLPQLIVQAKALAAENVPGGAAIDLEFYGAETIFPWWDHDVCYCDNCWARFCVEMDRDDLSRLAADARGICVRDSGFSQDYQDLMSRRVTDLMREMAQECRKIDPDFLLGFYPYVANWFCDAVLRGWSAPGLPALAISENEFSEGYNHRTLDRISHLKAAGIDALYVGGLFQGANYPEAYGAKAEEMVRRSDGYWLYYAAMFFMPEAELKLVPPDRGTEYTLSAKSAEYLSALRRANTRLSAGRGLPSAYPDRIDLTPQRTHISAPSTSSGKTQITNPGFEKGVSGWASVHPLPSVDKKVAHSGRRSLRFSPVDGASKGLLNITQPVNLSGDTEYLILLWVRVSGVADGQGIGLMVYPESPEVALGHYVPLRDLPEGTWMHVGRRFRTPKDVAGCVLSIHAACPKATLWIDDVEIAPVYSTTWVAGPLELPLGTRAGQLLWETPPSDSKVTVSVYDDATNERLQWSEKTGMWLSRLDDLPNRKFRFEILCESAGLIPDSPVERLWLEVSGKP